MRIFEVFPSKDSGERNSYQALVGIDTEAGYGIVRIEPPFWPSEHYMLAQEDLGYKLEHQLTTQSGTRLYLDMDLESQGVKERTQREHVDYISSVVAGLLDDLGETDRGRLFKESMSNQREGE